MQAIFYEALLSINVFVPLLSGGMEIVMLKRVLSAIAAASMIIGLFGMTMVTVSAAHPFVDIPKWANEYVETVYAKGIMQGIADTTFGSDGNLTREQLVVTLYRLSGSTVKGTDETLREHFADAADISKWAYNAVEWAYVTKITSGVKSGDELHFKPKNNVTRQEAAKFFVTYIDYMDLKAPTDKAADIKDMDTVAGWALPFVERCIAAGIINGDGNGNFDPYGNTSRIAAAKMLACLPTERNVKLIAHRGYCATARDNTAEAFIAAGERGYYGIEADTRLTADGEFVMIHDEDTSAVTNGETVVNISEATWEELQNIRLIGYDGTYNVEYKIPLVEDYISICKEYGKVPFLELKEGHTKEELQSLVSKIDSAGYLSETVFISFSWENCVLLREILPDGKIMLLMEDDDITDELIDQLAEYDLGLDIKQKRLWMKVYVEKCHQNGIELGVWTCDDPAEVEKFTGWGVDYITTNYLE